MVCNARSKTPGGKLVYLHIPKNGTIPKCGDSGCKLRGVCAFVIRMLIIGLGKAV